ncbi:MAG TPA: FAD/NAD(P)-binding protein [Candidatus Brocadiia bacterium]|nr:FAD/NAD(P)-binding protein [Candidatus Brocadiia bacterium]
MDNIYRPMLMTIENAIEEAPLTRTFKLRFQKDEEREAFFAKYRAGQFAEYSAFGTGESVFCVASPPTRREYVECTFRKVGRVTSAFYEMEPGQTMGFRGPYGNSFPIESWKGKSVVIVAGGIGLAPMRCLLWNVLDLRKDFADVTLIYGARTVADLVYKRELEEWRGRNDMNVVLTVDPGGETPDWTGRSGFVPTVVGEAKPSAENCVAIVCGPPIMIKFTLPVLEKIGFQKDNIFTTLENRMKCGLGKCGRCNVGKHYVCKDGPVFTIAQLGSMPDEY